MNKTENISAKPSRTIWFWCVGSLALLILLTAIAMPFVLKYQAIKHVEVLGGKVFTKPYSMFEALPDSWQEWIRSSLGDRIQSIETVTSISWYDSSICNDDLRYLKRFTKLTTLDIGNTQITDTGLSHLKGLTKLTHLMICDSQITDEGYIHLKELTNLKLLYLFNTQITDTGLNHLKGLSNLKLLSIANTQITDTGLSHLKGLTNLTKLDIVNTQVSKEGVAQLEIALPDCKINHPSASP